MSGNSFIGEILGQKVSIKSGELRCEDKLIQESLIAHLEAVYPHPFSATPQAEDNNKGEFLVKLHGGKVIQLAKSDLSGLQKGGFI